LQRIKAQKIDELKLRSTMVRPKFPLERFGEASTYCRAYSAESERAWRSIDPMQLDRAATMLIEAYVSGATVFACGNGGSAAVANHLQCDHSKGVRTSTDLTPHVVSLIFNIDLVTAIANDLGYENIFVYQLQSNVRTGDVLITISSSGNSANIVRALRWARDHEIQTIAFTGFDGGESAELADVSIHVDSMNYGIVEDIHQAIMHALAQYIRQSRMADDEIAKYTF
jgi:phosphoheptose isomerase